MGARDVMDQWDFSRMDEWVERNRIEWVRIPTASQHFNGNAEAMIKVTKKQLDAIMKDRNFPMGELMTLFSDISVILNSRPLMMKATGD